MKRGLIQWDQSELPAAAFAERLASCDKIMAEHDVPALVVYTDVGRSNDVRYVSNYMPYWNRAFSVVPRGGKPILLCALSPRVYPWIKTVTIHETIVASPSLPAQLAKLCAERSWATIGIVDHAGLPNDLYTQIAAEKFGVVDIPRGALRPVPTDAEISMHRRAAKLAREILTNEIGSGVIGQTDHAFAGHLERKLRRAGAEDLVLLVSNGRHAPRPPSGERVDSHFSAVVALEYSGHWAKVSRNAAGVECALPPIPGTTVHRETLSGNYAWESIANGDDTRDAVVSLQVEIGRDGRRLFYGDTCLQSRGTVTTL